LLTDRPVCAFKAHSSENDYCADRLVSGIAPWSEYCSLTSRLWVNCVLWIRLLG